MQVGYSPVTSLVPFFFFFFFFFLRRGGGDVTQLLTLYISFNGMLLSLDRSLTLYAQKFQRLGDLFYLNI